MTVAELEPDEKDAAAVFAWRFKQLADSGFELEDAVLLASRTDIDLHNAATLVARGCPPSLALRILL